MSGDKGCEGARDRAFPDSEARPADIFSQVTAGIVDTALDSIILIGEDSRVLEWNPAAERTFGVSRDEAIGADLGDLIIPPEQREAHRRGMARYLRTGKGPVIGRRIEVEAQTRDGRRMPVELAINPIPVEGRIIFAAYLRDVSARRESEQRLRATYEHAFAAIGEVGPDGRFVRVNEQFSAITGYSREELLARTIWDLNHPEDTEFEREVFARHMAGELPVYSLEKRYIHKDGHAVWVELSASTVDGPDGRPIYGIRVARDVTERRRWNERQQLLLNELNHRVKNTLAAVQSIAVQSARSAATPQASLSAFLERLMALARAHDVLTRQAWEGADMRTIVEEAVVPFGGEAMERFRIEGLPVWLDPQRALALALALHELATNAAKYGSLTAPKGCVAIDWRVEPREGERVLRFVWTESGGPPVAPPQRKGFGARLLERSLATDLGGTVHMDFRPGGLVCTVVATLEDRPPPAWVV